VRKASASLGALCIAVTAASCSSGNSNGVASKSPSQIVAAAIAAMKAAKSVHIQGSMTKSGKTEAIDLTLYANGDVSGSVTEGTTMLGIAKVGSTDYIKASAAYYTAQGATASVAGAMGNHWISLPESQGKFGNQFSLTSFADQVGTNEGTLTAGSTSTVDGQPVVSVNSSKGGTVYIATTGKPYPVKFVGTSASNGIGSFTFTAWDASSAPTPPAGAKPASSFGH
jgi:hypothetical protein